jgi:hypothetical protein
MIASRLRQSNPLPALRAILNSQEHKGSTPETRRCAIDQRKDLVIPNKSDVPERLGVSTIVQAWDLFFWQQIHLDSYHFGKIVFTTEGLFWHFLLVCLDSPEIPSAECGI